MKILHRIFRVIRFIVWLCLTITVITPLMYWIITGKNWDKLMPEKDIIWNL